MKIQRQVVHSFDSFNEMLDVSHFSVNSPRQYTLIHRLRTATASLQRWSV